MKIRVLIADDHILFRRGLAMLLHEAFPDATSTEADSVDAALEKVRNEGPFDLVLMDLIMPGGCVRTALKTLQDEFPKLPVVIVSSSEAAEDVWSTLEAGAKGYILKSSTVDVFKSAMQLVLCGERYVPPVVFERPQVARGGGRLPSDALGLGEHTENLTRRQQEVLDELAKGLTNKEIARNLGLLEGTVKIHVKEILRKLNVRNRTEAVVVGQKEGLVIREGASL